MTDANASTPEGGLTREQIADAAREERRLGLLILENRAGAALAAGVPHFRRAADLWEQSGWPTRRAECLVDLGKLHTKSGNFADAAKTLVDALRMLEGAGEQRLSLEAATQAGLAYLALKDADPAVRHLKRSLELAEELNDHVQIGICLLDLANGYVAKKESASAIKCCERALVIFTSFRKGPLRAQTHECMAAANAIAGDYVAAAKQYEASYTISTELARSFDATETLSRWAEMERKHANFDEAIRLHERCIGIHKQTGNKALLAQSLRRLGLVHAKRGQPEQAIECYLKSLDLCEVVNDTDGVSRSLYLLGAAEANCQRGDAALAHLERSLQVAKESL